MAFTDIEKECIDAYDEYLQRRKRLYGKRLDAQSKADLQTIRTGTEADKKTAAKWYAENVDLPQVQAALAGIDQKKTDLQTRETDLNALIAS